MMRPKDLAHVLVIGSQLQTDPQIAALLAQSTFVVDVLDEMVAPSLPIFDPLPDVLLVRADEPGIRLCMHFTAHPSTQDIPVLLYQTTVDSDQPVEAIQAGAVAYVQYNNHPDVLLAHLDRALLLARRVQALKAQHRMMHIRLGKEQRYFEKTNRLKDEFVQTIVHDLKNPVNAIINLVHLLRSRENAIQPRENALLDQIDSSAQRMNMLIKNLLDLSRLEEGITFNFQRVPINVFLRNQVENFRRKAHGRPINVTLEMLETETAVEIDAARIAQVLDNLLTNAVKYAGETSDVITVELAIKLEGEYILIIVADHGLGVPEEDLPYLFDKFYRVEQPAHLRSEGTGLGLAIAKAIVEQHRGRIEVESQFGVGSTFTITLPLRIFP